MPNERMLNAAVISRIFYPLQRRCTPTTRVHSSFKYTGNFKTVIADHTENNASPPSMSLVIEIQGEGGWGETQTGAFFVELLVLDKRSTAKYKF